MSYYLHKSWKYAKSFWPWRSSSTASTVIENDFIIIDPEKKEESDKKVEHFTWMPFQVEDPKEPFSLDKTYDLMMNLRFQSELDETNYLQQKQHLRESFYYFCQHKDYLMEHCFSIYMTFQDLLISYAFLSNFRLREEFEYLYGYNLDDVCSLDAIILPFCTPPNYCEQRTDYLSAVEKMICLITDIEDVNHKKVLYIQLFNYACNNAEMSKKCPLLLDSIVDKLEDFEENYNVTLPVQKEILKKLK